MIEDPSILPPHLQKRNPHDLRPAIRKHTSCCARHPQSPDMCFAADRCRLRARAHTLQAGMHQQPTARPTSRIGQPSAYRSTFARISARLHTAGGRCAYYLATRHPGGEPGCLTSLTLGTPARRTRCCEHERAAGLFSQHV